METKKKTTFNLSEHTHQGLKFAAASQKREMAELLEEALSTYFGWNKMTKIEQDELELFRIAERSGPGQATEANFNTISNTLDTAAVLSQLLQYLHGRYLIVEINDNRTGYRDFNTFPEGTASLYHGGAIRLRLTIPGRQRFEQLQAREKWETTGGQLERWVQKATAFRSERVAALENGESFVPLAAGPRAVLHCVPLESFGTNASRDVFALDGVLPMYSSRLNAWGHRINIAGSICIAAPEPSMAYTQIYRNGAIEAVRVGILSSSNNPGIIPILSYEEAVIQYVPHCFQLMRQLGCTAPILLGISLIGVMGLTMAGSETTIDRNVLALPGIVVEDLSVRPSTLLKPAFDLVWNACGSPASPYFDDSGNWVGIVALSSA